MNQEEENVLFNLASEVINFTGRNLFLTGKAGTGKTTFLKHICTHTVKSTVVVAPTGVAAINAGGVTMHSFFQLPFVPFLAHETKLFGNTASVDRHGLIKNIRFNKQKLELLYNLELLIIDEVSMLRADMLDAIDEILRYFRRKPSLPFGGVQVLLIGDLYQLPPVVGEDEWVLMKDHYSSPFFFSAKVIENNPPLFIELKKVYRQKEEQFIDLLNKLRHNSLSQSDLHLLQSRYNPDASALSDVITLCTYNYMADKINLQELQKLPGETYSFQGEIEGDFSEKALPTEMQLNLKIGAQVMFLKNDTDPEKRYFNGKLARVIGLTSNTISVAMTDSGYEMELEKEKWSNIRYSLNKESNKIEEEELGSFKQFPIRLAWAITIHKSQGLSFDKVIIDAGSSFAAGQVYVALSRCRSLDGISLLSPITTQSLKSDQRITEFSGKELSPETLESILSTEKPLFASQVLLKAFDWSALVIAFQEFAEITQEKKLPKQEWLSGVSTGLIEQVTKQQEIADKFCRQLSQILSEQPVNEALLNERVVKAKHYFMELLANELLKPIEEVKQFLKGKTKVKSYQLKVIELEAQLRKKIELVQHISYGGFSFKVKEPDISIPQEKEVSKKPVKGDSQLVTLGFYKEGLSIEEIAKQRGMTIGTIEGHLATFIASGTLVINSFVEPTMVAKVADLVKDLGATSLTQIKTELKDDISFGKLKMVIAHLTLKRDA